LELGALLSRFGYNATGLLGALPPLPVITGSGVTMGEPDCVTPIA
jgi:hypothetical protein